MIQCDRCNGNTVEKRRTKKSDGTTFLVYECQNGCMNGEWKYTCFAPKVSKPPFVRNPQKQTGFPVFPPKAVSVPQAHTIDQKVDMLIQKVDDLLQTIKGYVPEPPFGEK